MSMNQGDSILRKVEKLIFRLIPLIFLGILLIYFSFFHDGELSQNSFAQFGDYFGGILNPILSFLAVMMLLVSIRLQADELSATRKELKETKDIHSENIRTQENLFAVQVITTEVKELLGRVSEIVKLTSEATYLLENGETVSLQPAHALGQADTDKMVLMEYDSLDCFMSEYSYIIASLTDDMRNINGYLNFAKEKGLVKELMPIYSIRKVFSICASVHMKKTNVHKVLSNIPMCEVLTSTYEKLEKDMKSLSDILEVVYPQLPKL